MNLLLGNFLLYIGSHLFDNPHHDLNIYKAKQLESTFAEIIIPKKVILSLVVFTNIKMRMLLILLKNNYLSQIFEIIPKERKQIFLLGDFNINLLKCNDHQPTNNILKFTCL